ncbi:MAG: hypothetical protein R2759_00380 [Bacteroidales bacterium]
MKFCREVTAISGVDKNWMAVDQSTGGPYSGYLYTVMTTSSGGAFARIFKTMEPTSPLLLPHPHSPCRE